MVNMFTHGSLKVPQGAKCNQCLPSLPLTATIGSKSHNHVARPTKHSQALAIVQASTRSPSPLVQQTMEDCWITRVIWGRMWHQWYPNIVELPPLLTRRNLTCQQHYLSPLPQISAGSLAFAIWLSGAQVWMSSVWTRPVDDIFKV